MSWSTVLQHPSATSPQPQAATVAPAPALRQRAIWWMLADLQLRRRGSYYWVGEGSVSIKS